MTSPRTPPMMGPHVNVKHCNVSRGGCRQTPVLDVITFSERSGNTYADPACEQHIVTYLNALLREGGRAPSGSLVLGVRHLQARPPEPGHPATVVVSGTPTK